VHGVRASNAEFQWRGGNHSPAEGTRELTRRILKLRLCGGCLLLPGPARRWTGAANCSAA
jgi:hypothetical protein